MNENTILLCGTAASIAVLHTLFGPDHYVPFVAMSRARNWSTLRTFVITVLCGIGHVGSSVVLGLIGIAFGIAVLSLETIESYRGDFAAWMLIAFGLAYMAWGIRRAIRNKPHTHFHVHADGTGHTHEHAHDHEHAHVHVHDAHAEGTDTVKSITPWVLFTIFVFGPCEPLIPLLMYPAAKGNLIDVLLVTAVFSVCTIGTMTTIVMLSVRASDALPKLSIERYGHAVAGALVLACGLAVKFGL